MKNNAVLKESRFPVIGIMRSQLPMKTKLELVWRRCKNGVTNIPVYFLLIAMSFVFLLPFVYMIFRSLMDSVSIMNATLVKWLPRSFTDFSNYSLVINKMDYWNKLWTSLWTTGLGVLGQLLTCTFVAYGLARIKFRGSGLIFGLVIFTLIVPPQVTIAPTYIMFSNNSPFNLFFGTEIFNLTETFWPMILPCFFGLGLSGGLFIFIYRQFFRGMPEELENAALIDGCGVFGSYFRIILPNAKSPMLVCLLLSMVWQWNNFFEPSVFIKNVSVNGNLPMQLLGLGAIVNDASAVNANNGIHMAGTFLVVLPIILVFFLLQNQFMKSIERVGLAN